MLQVKKPCGLRYSVDVDGGIRVKSGDSATEVSKKIAYMATILSRKNKLSR